MESYYIFSNGKLMRKDNNICFDEKFLKIEMTNDIYLFGEVDLNSKCLNFLGQNKVSIHFFNYYGFYTGSFFPKETNVSGKLLVKQVNYFQNEIQRVEIAKEIIKSACSNIFRNMRYYNGRGKDLNYEMEIIKNFQLQIDNLKTVSEIMGIEGNIRKVYYSAWNKLINQEINFEKRVKRPPDNMINTLISFINSLMYTTCLGEIYKTQLNPTISYLHSPGDRRFSLCLDISEIFKPLVVDRMIFSLLNKKIITEDDFETKSNFCYLKEKGKKKILVEYENRLKRTITHKDLGREVTYKYLIRLECYKLIKHLLGDKKYCGFKMWW
ncbi:type I-B CRISPR-associated endonuclease Cas1b [Fusobacterium hominis]|uniref:CRISPR-associated endonuclease Cas1 n=1 Tax=Fusobacterium hominis TaxID=2764326 RepID=A0A7G9GWD2_9FUSO|nr:type I-B CRISPR-associated endonuclease Cas1b [Fusobacterium hominis]QNM15114.1 type I-B CRISPR-associated endonuclease Cas1 [Fusobacterium hominis]